MATIRCDLNGVPREVNKNTDMALIDTVLKKIDKLFLALGFKSVELKHADPPARSYVYRNLYCISQFGWAGRDGFFVEYADSHHEAINNLFEDGDCFPMELGEAAILEGIKNELLEAIKDEKIAW